MFAKLRSRLFNAFANWAIQRAMRTPYTHLFHDDGRPYMQRFWLLRIGMPKGWRDTEKTATALEMEAMTFSHIGKPNQAGNRMRAAADLREKLYPRFGIRIHRIMSGDERAFHDHPWNFTTLILRGGYTEMTLSGVNTKHITMTTEYDGAAPVMFTHYFAVRYGAGTVLRRKASDWHYLQLDPGEETWTMFCTGRKRQRWGFLVDGLFKVPYDVYLRARKARMVRDAQWPEDVRWKMHPQALPPHQFSAITPRAKREES